MSKTLDQRWVEIMLGNEPGKLKALKVLEAQAEVLEGRGACPECGHKGPHEDNGATRPSELTFLCQCGTQFDAEAM